MKQYTQEDFNNLPVDENGYKQCPSGDYTLIKVFGESCSFGKYCSFSEWCSFGEKCSFGKYCSFSEWCSFGKSCSFEDNAGKGDKILQIRAGSGMRTSTAFLLDTGIFIRSGCFFGTLDTFIETVKKTHRDNNHGKAYMLWVEIIKLYNTEE